jgi:hypothetical protein
VELRCRRFTCQRGGPQFAGRRSADLVLAAFGAAAPGPKQECLSGKQWPTEGRALPAGMSDVASARRLGYVRRLWTFRPLNNLELDRVSFLQGAVSVADDG